MMVLKGLLSFAARVKKKPFKKESSGGKMVNKS